MQLPSEATATLKVPSPQGNQCDRRPFISSVDYSSITSVFPAEACETVGGEACDAEMYPEVKLKPEEGRSSIARTSSEQLDRDYLEYDNPKTPLYISHQFHQCHLCFCNHQVPGLAMQLPSEATATLKVPSPQGNQCDRRPFISSADYSSITSVFPAEACETVGGEACDAEMYPEVKLKPEEGRSSIARTSSEQLDRDYLEYDNPTMVFPGEACDDLGGEFCEPEYQRGVN